MNNMAGGAWSDGFSFTPFRLRKLYGSLVGCRFVAMALICLLVGSLSFKGGAAAAEGALVGIGLEQGLRGLWLLLAILFLLLSMRRFSLRKMRMGRWIFIYTLFCVSSSLWSANYLMTFGKSLELMVAMMIFIVAANLERPLVCLKALMSLILALSFWLIVVGLAGYVAGLEGYYEEGGNSLVSKTLCAPFLSANSFGYLSSSLLLIVISLHIQKRVTATAAIGYAGVFATVLLLSTSRSGLAIALGGVLFIMLVKSKKLFVASSVALMIFWIVGWGGLQDFFLEGHNEEFFMTLSGRTVLWDAAFDGFLQNPVAGAGYGVGTKLAISNLPDFQDAAISSAHNGFLEILSGVGMIGAALFSVPFIYTIYFCLAKWKRYPNHVPIFILIFPTVITTVMSIGAGGWFSIMVAIFFCMVAVIDVINSQGGRTQADYLRRSSAG